VAFSRLGDPSIGDFQDAVILAQFVTPQQTEQAGRLGLEGIVSKRRDAPYRSGRVKEWLKIKCVLRQEFVVVGYVPSTTSRGIIGSLLGFYEKEKLVHAGRVGTCFSQDVAASLFGTLDGERIDNPNFGNKVSPEAARNVRWVTPKLVVEVEYRGWSNDGLLRHSTFRGLRQDREPLDVTREGDSAAPVAGTSPAAALTSPDRCFLKASSVSRAPRARRGQRARLCRVDQEGCH
jgi:bifunctional non-homologous end joining protein LigD